MKKRKSHAVKKRKAYRARCPSCESARSREASQRYRFGLRKYRCRNCGTHYFTLRSESFVGDAETMVGVLICRGVISAG